MSQPPKGPVLFEDDPEPGPRRPSEPVPSQSAPSDQAQAARRERDRDDTPVLIDLANDQEDRPNPASAPPVDDAVQPVVAGGTAMERLAALTARRSSPVARLFWSALGGFLSIAIGIAAWDFVTGLLARSPLLGAVVSACLVAALLALLVMIGAELAALARLRRIDGLQKQATTARQSGDLPQARAVTDGLEALYAHREELSWGHASFKERRDEMFDASALLDLAERSYLEPLDRAAQTEIEAAARQVATVTALVPLALADVVAALAANLRMIRRIAAIYGGRSGTLGNWRLTRAVMAHLVATGAVAIGDDLVGAAAGGGVLAKLSRRFGEGFIN
ncbi:MAG: TIGR01620 family protein, partial [Pseudomonadota bacterium]